MRFLISCIVVTGLMLVATGPSANALHVIERIKKEVNPPKLTPEQQKVIKEKVDEYARKHPQK